jgi:hypothetical protein
MTSRPLTIPLHLFRNLQRVGKGFACFDIRGGPFYGHLREGSQLGHRGAQFVGDVGAKSALSLKCFLEAR